VLGARVTEDLEVDAEQSVSANPLARESRECAVDEINDSRVASARGLISRNDPRRNAVDFGGLLRGKKVEFGHSARLRQTMRVLRGCKGRRPL
jgi:hypothetical protein